MSIRLKLKGLMLHGVVALVVAGSTLAAPEPGSYRHFSRPPYDYFFAGKDEATIEKLDRNLRRLVPEIESHLAARIPDRLRVELPLTKSEFSRITKGRVPGWAGGVAYPEEARIVAKAPTYFGEGIALSVLVAHEISHVLIHQATQGNDVPRWLDEGLAQVLAGESRSGSTAKLARAALANRLMGLPRVEDVLRFSAFDAGLAYAESQSAANFLIQEYGWETVRKILFLVGEGAEFDSAFQQSTGVEYEAWQVEWIEAAQSRYRNFVFLDVDSLIWTFILLLGAAAVIAVWVRKRRQFKKWLEEEDEDDDDSNGNPPPIEESPPVENKPINP